MSYKLKYRLNDILNENDLLEDKGNSLFDIVIKLSNSTENLDKQIVKFPKSYSKKYKFQFIFESLNNNVCIAIRRRYKNYNISSLYQLEKVLIEFEFYNKKYYLYNNFLIDSSNDIVVLKYEDIDKFELQDNLFLKEFYKYYNNKKGWNMYKEDIMHLRFDFKERLNPKYKNLKFIKKEIDEVIENINFAI